MGGCGGVKVPLRCQILISAQLIRGIGLGPADSGRRVDKIVLAQAIWVGWDLKERVCRDGFARCADAIYAPHRLYHWTLALGHIIRHRCVRVSTVRVWTLVSGVANTGAWNMCYLCERRPACECVLRDRDAGCLGIERL